MAKTVVRVEGLRQLGEAMRRLGNDVGTKIARAATAAGAQVVRKKAVELAPVADEPYTIEGVTVQPGNIPKNIVTRRLKASESDLTSEHIVTVRGKAKHGYASRVGALQEFGTVNHPPQPFMRPAYEQKKGEALSAVTKRLQQRILKAGKT